MLETLTDNKNRTVSEIRHLLSKHGGNLGETNSVAWMFTKQGYILIEKSKVDEDGLMGVALDTGADDVRDDQDNWEVLTSPEDFHRVLEAVKGLGVETLMAEVAMLPQNYINLEGKAAQQMMKLMGLLEDHDDVQHVWSNFNVEEKEIEASLM